MPSPVRNGSTSSGARRSRSPRRIRRATSSAGRPSPSRSARQRSAIASSSAVRFSRTQPNRNGVLWCGAGAVSATPTARRSAAGSTGSSAKSRTLRRSSTASRRPWPSASSVPSQNRSSSSGRTRSRAVEPSSTGSAPAHHRDRDAAELALDQVGGGGELVGQRHLGDQQLVALDVHRAGVAVQHREPGRADRGVGLPDPPAAAHRVGDDHGDVDAEQSVQRGAQPGGAAVRIGGQQGQLVAAHVRAVDAGGGLHDAELVRDDQGLPAAGQHPLALGVDELAAQPVARLRVGGRGHEPALDLGHHLAGDDHDVAVGQPRRRGRQRRGQVVARAELGQAGHGQDLQAGRRRVVGDLSQPAAPHSSRAARAIAAVASTSVISSGTARTSTPGTSAVSPVCTSQPSSSPPSARAP